MQTTLRMESTILPGHRLEISNPEFPDGATVEVTVVLPEQPTPDIAREKARGSALDQFLALARSSSFRSAGPYPTRDELHERP